MQNKQQKRQKISSKQRTSCHSTIALKLSPCEIKCNYTYFSPMILMAENTDP